MYQNENKNMKFQLCNNTELSNNYSDNFIPIKDLKLKTFF